MQGRQQEGETQRHLQARRARLLDVLLNDSWRSADDVLALLVLDEIEVVEGADDVIRLDHGGCAEVLNADAALLLLQHLQSQEHGHQECADLLY